MKKYKVAVLGATGLVGTHIIDGLQEREFPISELIPLASEGRDRTVRFGGEEIPVRAASFDKFNGVDLVFNCAGNEAARIFLSQLAKKETVCIDKSTAFRLDTSVPLIIPEVNGSQMKRHQGIIASPNCLTIQLVMALWPVYCHLNLEKVVLSTYQSASGAGTSALQALKRQMRGDTTAKSSSLPHSVAGNAFPEIGGFVEDGFSTEESKITAETQKIIEDRELPVTVTAVRIGVEVGHAVSVWCQTSETVNAENLVEILDDCEWLTVSSEPHQYHTPKQAAGTDEVFVGRIRTDKTDERAFWMWITADNLRKGAATNAIQIAETLMNEDLI